MEFTTERLELRPWNETDAEVLYQYARNPLVGPIAGWPIHKDTEDSRQIIKHVLSQEGTFAVVLKETTKPIGSIGLMIGSQSNFEIPKEEGEIGYWIGESYWGRGLIPEAVYEILRYGFEQKQLETIWCGYFDGNEKSKRVQEKCGFIYQYTKKNMYWKLTDQYLTEHISLIRKENWIQSKQF
jgi:RimJ/RimL family protein N-acetyltransferase